MAEDVKITSFNYELGETIEFRIVIPKNMAFRKTIEDVDLQQKLSDASNSKNNVQYIDAIKEIVRRMEAHSG